MKSEEIKKYLQRQTKYIDRTYWVLLIALIIVAIIAFFSASSSLAYKDGALAPIGRQMLFLLVGVALVCVVQFVPSKWIRLLAYPGLLLSFVLLLLTTFTDLGVTRNGATRWIELAGIEFQPSELAKLCLIIVVSDLLSRIRTKQEEKKYFFIVLGITILICALILPSNLSTTLLLGGIVLLLLFLAKVHLKYLGTTLGIAIVLLIAGYFFVEYRYIKPGREVKGFMGRAATWAGRVDDMLAENDNPDKTYVITDDNIQQAYAKVAIARGGKSPIGVLPGNSTVRDYLPLAFADYIFAIIVEETGVCGAIVLILLYMAILFRACYTSSRYADYSAMLMVMGLALMITCQALISMLVAVGLGPVTGQPLPMICRGGTSILVTSLYFGIIMGVAREQNELQARQQATQQTSWEDVPDIHIDESVTKQ